jgi:hypothetical protein
MPDLKGRHVPSPVCADRERGSYLMVALWLGSRRPTTRVTSYWGRTGRNAGRSIGVALFIRTTAASARFPSIIILERRKSMDREHIKCVADKAKGAAKDALGDAKDALKHAKE